MKFLCPNCKSKYRIGSEKLVGRQAAKIRCRNCDYRIQIAYRPGSDEYDITATPNSVVPSALAPRQFKAPPGPPVGAPPPPAGVVRPRPAAAPLPSKEEGGAARKPTAAVPGLPNLGSPKSTRGAALLSEGPLGAAQLQPRRPLAPPPPPVGAPPFGSLGLGTASFGSGGVAGLSAGASAAMALPPLAPPPAPKAVAKAIVPPVAPTPARAPAAGTQLADQFRQSVQAGEIQEELPQEGWFVGVNGVPLGPIPVGDLRELANAGHIDRRSLVWRDGQAEWRPLGKFQQLARLLDDGAGGGGLAEPENSAPVAQPAEPRPNGANGHAATGFDVVRADTGERPSVWGDLDDEDDEDEQPTTVKGRVSVSPPGMGGMPATSVPPSVPPPPSALLQGSVTRAPGLGAAFGAPPPSRAPAAPFHAQPHSAPPVTPDGGPASTISTTPEPVVDEADARIMRPRGRGRLSFIAVAVVVAFALGAVLMHLLRSPAAEDPKLVPPEPTRALAPSPEAPAAPPPKPAEEQMPAPDPELAPAAMPPATAQPSALLQVPKPVVGGTGVVLSPAHQPQVIKPPGGGSLLSGLGPTTPGPMTGLKAGEGHAGGPGLDATAIQRTVRRYSPGVRQNCWQRALNARAPGVPSSAKVTALITVDAAGRVQAVTVSGAPRGYPGLARCIEGSVKGWQFPRAGGETVTNVPFMFVGQ